MLQQALEMQEAAKPPTSHADLAASLLNLALVLHNLGECTLVCVLPMPAVVGTGRLVFLPDFVALSAS